MSRRVSGEMRSRVTGVWDGGVRLTSGGQRAYEHGIASVHKYNARSVQITFCTAAEREGRDGRSDGRPNMRTERSTLQIIRISVKVIGASLP